MKTAYLSLAFVMLMGCGRSGLGPCAQGGEGCACHANGDCGTGLACVANTCEHQGAPGEGGGVRGGGGQGGSGGRSGTGGWMGPGVTAGTGGWTDSDGSTSIGGWTGTGVGTGTGGQTGWGTNTSMGGFGGRATAYVTFRDGKAQDTGMNGRAWVSLGAKDILSSPTCAGAPITSTTLCSSTITWSGNGLCISGAIPALPASPSKTDREDNWGIMIGVNATLEPGGTLGSRFRHANFTVVGAPPSGAWAVVHRKGDPGSVEYCARIVDSSSYSSALINMDAFTTNCRENPGNPLTQDDVAHIDWIAVQIPPTKVDITVAMCWTNVSFDAF